MLVYRIDEISTLTVNEWIDLKATLHSMDDRRYNCNECLSQYGGRQDRERMIQASRNLKACDFIANDIRHSIGDKIKFRTCIGNFVSESALHIIDLHSHFTRGVMPFDGPLTSQPAKIIDAFGVIDGYRHQVAVERAEQQRRKQMIGSRGARG